jgi:hypothetical protein
MSDLISFCIRQQYFPGLEVSWPKQYDWFTRIVCLDGSVDSKVQVVIQVINMRAVYFTAAGPLRRKLT